MRTWPCCLLTFKNKRRCTSVLNQVRLTEHCDVRCIMWEWTQGSQRLCPQLLDPEYSRLLHHLRRLLLSGVSAQRGHVHRGDAADLRPQRQTQQPHAARGGKYPRSLQRFVGWKQVPLTFTYRRSQRVFTLRLKCWLLRSSGAQELTL